METLGVVLGLGGIFVLGAGLWTVLRPFRNGLLTSRLRGAGAIFAGLALLVVGGSLIPPVEGEPAEDQPPAAASPATDADRSPAPVASSTQEADPVEEPVGPPAPAFEQTRDEVLERLNRTWREGRQLGAFAVDTETRVSGAANEGGVVSNACASDRACILITTNREGRVMSLTMLASHADQGGTGTTLLASLAALTLVGDPTAARGDEFRRQLDLVSSGARTRSRRAGDACIHVTGGQGLGVWTSVSKPPCDN